MRRRVQDAWHTTLSQSWLSSLTLPFLVPPGQLQPLAERPGTEPLSWTSLILEHCFPRVAVHWNHLASFLVCRFVFFNSAAWVLPPETPISLVCHAAWEAGFLKPFLCNEFHVLASGENRDGNDSSGNGRTNLQGSEPSVVRVFWFLRASAWPEAALFEKRLVTQRLATSLIESGMG